MLTLLAVALAVVLAQAAPAPGLSDVNFLATAAVGFVASLALGGTKVALSKVAVKIGGVDTRITAAIKPIQPLLLLGLTWGLPRIGAALGIIPPEASDFISAPLATVIGVSAREGTRRLFPNRQG